MRRRRYNSSPEPPRIEMTPLLDTIFLLLTFFIYSMVLTVRAQVLPVALPDLTQGEVVREANMASVTVGANGQLFFDRQPITFEGLRDRLVDQIVSQGSPPAIFIASEVDQVAVDRFPIFVQLYEMLQKIGIKKLYVVGQDRSATAPDEPTD